MPAVAVRGRGNLCCRLKHARVAGFEECATAASASASTDVTTPRWRGRLAAFERVQQARRTRVAMPCRLTLMSLLWLWAARKSQENVCSQCVPLGVGRDRRCPWA